MITKEQHLEMTKNFKTYNLEVEVFKFADDNTTVKELKEKAPYTQWYHSVHEGITITHNGDFIKIDNKGFIENIITEEFKDIQIKYIIDYAKNLNNFDFL